MRNLGIAALAALMLAGCAQKIVYLRIDGRDPNADAVLAQQFEVDRAICSGEREKANLSGVTVSGGGFAGVAAAIERGQSANTVGNGCLAQRGYLAVPEDQAAAKAAQLAAVEAERQRQEAATQPAIAPMRPARRPPPRPARLPAVSSAPQAAPALYAPEPRSPSGPTQCIADYNQPGDCASRS